MLPIHTGICRSLNLDKSGQVNWSSNVKNLLFSIGERFQRLWDTQDTSSDPKAIASSSEIIHQLYIYIDKLTSDIQTSRDGKTLWTYRLFKTEFCLEHYLLGVIRCVPAQYRLSSYNLGIETDRHTKPSKPQNNVYSYTVEMGVLMMRCNGSIGRPLLYRTEKSAQDKSSKYTHKKKNFLTECDINTETRQMFISNIKSFIDGHEDLPATEKFVTAIKNSCRVVIKELAKIVYKAFQQRLHHV